MAAAALLAGHPLAAADSNFNVPQARKGVVFIKRITPGVGPVVGSGFLVSKDGLIYTNRHVVVPFDESLKGSILVVGVPQPKDPDELDYFRAELVYTPEKKENLDFAVLKIAAKPDYPEFKPLSLASEKLGLGDEVAAIGYPHIKDNMPVLTFTKGAISATKVKLDEHLYYQTDATVNRGNSGSPLLNGKGEVAGIVSLKKGDANKMGYALYLSEIKDAEVKAKEVAARSKPEQGPLDPKKLPAPAGITAKKDSWEIGQGDVKEGKDHLVIDANGGQYWLVSKEALPENFQLVIPCQVEFLKGNQKIQPSQRSILRMLCIRFGTADTKTEIMERKGNLIQFSHALLHLWKEGEVLKTEQKGNGEDAFTIVITRQGGEITIAVDGEILLKHKDDKPLKGEQKFCIGGYLSRLYLGEVSVLKLDSEDKPK
jgi:hypothetical protein